MILPSDGLLSRELQATLEVSKVTALGKCVCGYRAGCDIASLLICSDICTV